MGNIKEVLQGDADNLLKDVAAKSYIYDYDSVKKITEPVEEAIKDFGYDDSSELKKEDEEYAKAVWNFYNYKEEVEVYGIPLTRGAVYYYENNKDAGIEV